MENTNFLDGFIMKKLSTTAHKHNASKAAHLLDGKKTILLALSTLLVLAVVGENIRLALLNW